MRISFNHWCFFRPHSAAMSVHSPLPSQPLPEFDEIWNIFFSLRPLPPPQTLYRLYRHKNHQCLFRLCCFLHLTLQNLNLKCSLHSVLHLCKLHCFVRCSIKKSSLFPTDCSTLFVITDWLQYVIRYHRLGSTCWLRFVILWSETRQISQFRTNSFVPRTLTVEL